MAVVRETRRGSLGRAWDRSEDHTLMPY